MSHRLLQVRLVSLAQRVSPASQGEVVATGVLVSLEVLEDQELKVKDKPHMYFLSFLGFLLEKKSHIAIALH